MKPKVLITSKLPAIAEQILEKKFDVTVHEQDTLLTKKQKIDAVKNYDVILCTLHDLFDQAILQEADKTKLISNYAVGLDNIDLKAAEKNNIKVCHLPDIVTDSTADLAMALLLSFVRRIIPASEYVKKTGWTIPIINRFNGEELMGKTFGIIGYGRIGKAVATRAFGFGLKVICSHRRKLESSDLFDGQVKQVSLDELYQTSDYVSIHVPLTNETKQMFDEKAFKQMKKRPLILNLARGIVVDTQALMDALQSKQIRGAVLDVTDPEPLPKNHALLKFENVLVIPHIGTSTVECRKKMAQMAAENIQKDYGSK